MTPLGTRIIDTNTAHRFAPVQIVERINDVATRRNLLVGGAGIFKVQKHMIDTAGRRLFNHPGIAGRDGELTPATAPGLPVCIQLCHLMPPVIGRASGSFS